MQRFECGTSLGFCCGLARDIGVVSRIGEQPRRMCVAGAAVDAAFVDEEIAGAVFFKQRMFGVRGDG